MIPNILVLALAAFIPLAVGFVWHNPKVFGTAWLKASNMNAKKMKGANMLVLFVMSYVCSFFISLILYQMVVHQSAFYSLLADAPGFHDPDSEIQKYITNFMIENGRNFRTIKHGLFHGSLAGVLFVTPIIATNAMFERKGFKYIAINGGYWTVSLALMGAAICAFA